jgi:hypothetical protein
LKALLLSGLTLAILTGSAFAQTNGQPPAPPAQGMAAPPPPGPGVAPPPPPPPGVAPPPMGRGAEAGDMDGPPRPPGGSAPRGQRPPPERAAHFRLQRGDALLDVKCAEEETMKACGDLALQMVDRLQATPKP